MWGDTSFGGSNTQARKSTSSLPDKDKARGFNNVMPVTIRQLLKCQDTTFAVAGVEASVVTIVGLIRSVNSTATKLSICVDDQTGTIECVHYMGIGMDGSGDEPEKLAEGTYGRFTGAFRTSKDGNYLNIYRSFPLTDLNELTCHLLEVLVVGQKLKKWQNEAEKAKENEVNSMTVGLAGTTAAGMAGAVGPTGLFTSGGGGMGVMPGFTPRQNQVFREIETFQGDEGIHRNEIISRLRGRLPVHEINAIMEFLSNEGHIYTTSDDDHYATT